MTQKRVMNKDDAFKFRWLQDGKFSPDGKRVIYVVSHIMENVKSKTNGKAEDKEYNTLYLLDVETGASRKMTTGKHRDSSPAWSPDGKTIAFVSDRAEKSQIYLLPVDGGESEQLTDLPQGAGNPVWSPDGTMIAFTAGIDWGEDKPDRSKDPYRVTRNVWRFDALGDLDLAVTNLYTINVGTGEVKQLTDSPTVDGSIRWSPDGKRILFAALMQPDTFKIYQAHPLLYMVDMNGDVEAVPPDQILLGEGFWLPDSRRIAFVGRPDNNNRGTGDLWVYDMQTGTFDNRTPSMELAIGGTLSGHKPSLMTDLFFGFSADGKHAYAQVQKGGAVQIYRIALTENEDYEAVVSGDRACYLLDMNGDRLLYAVEDITNTPDLHVADLDGSGERRVTQLNDDFMAQFIMPEHQNLHFKGSDGADVEGWFVHPTTGAKGPHPTILWIHGGPHGAQGSCFSFESHIFAGAGYGVLFINHRASTGYSDEFTTAIKGDWGNLEYHDLMAGVDYAIARGLADADKLGCCGISGGGNLSCWIVGQTDRFKAAIPQNPVSNFQSFYGLSDIGLWFSLQELGGHPHEIPEIYDACSPITYAHRCTTPTLLIQAEHDWRCPPDQSEQFYTVLKANGCIVEMQRHPGGAHGSSLYGPLPLRKAHIEAHLDWFDRYILGKEPENEERLA